MYIHIHLYRGWVAVGNGCVQKMCHLYNDTYIHAIAIYMYIPNVI